MRSASLSWTCGHNSLDLNPVDYAVWEPCRSKSAMAGSSTSLIAVVHTATALH